MIQSKLGRNSIWMILSRFAAQGLVVIFTVLLARRLGSAGFGAYNFIAAILFIANALTTFGTDMLLIRVIAASNDLSDLPIALVVQFVLSLILIAAVWSFGTWIPGQNPETIMALKVYSFALIPLAFFTVFTTALRGSQHMDMYALLNVIFSVLQVGAILMLRGTDLVLLSVFLLGVQAFSALFAGLFCAFFIPHFWGSWSLSSFLPSFASFSSFLKATAPIAFLTLLGILYQRLSVTMLSLMTNPTQTGIFSAAARVVEASKTVHVAVLAVLYPAMAQEMSFRTSRRGSNSPVNLEIASLGFDARESNNRFARSSLAMIYLTAGAILVSVVLFASSRSLVVWLYGSDYVASAHVLRILAWVLIPFTVNSYLTLSYLASNQEASIGRALMACVLGLLILNLWWIPAHGVEGGAWAILLAESLQSVILIAARPSYLFIRGGVDEFSELP